MNLIDANILLCAYNRSSVQHAAARRWLATALSQREPVGLAWVTIMAFLRIATNPRAFENPLSPAEAVQAISDWLQVPAIVVLNPGERHWRDSPGYGR